MFIILKDLNSNKQVIKGQNNNFFNFFYCKPFLFSFAFPNSSKLYPLIYPLCRFSPVLEILIQSLTQSFTHALIPNLVHSLSIS